MILSDKPYKPLGAPPALIRGNVSTISRDLNPSQVRASFRTRLLAYQTTRMLAQRKVLK
jgi:hypothetical protein